MWAVLQIWAMEIPASASYRRCRISLSVCWECRIGLMLSCVIGRSFNFGLSVRSLRRGWVAFYLQLGANPLRLHDRKDFLSRGRAKQFPRACTNSGADRRGILPSAVRVFG